jgi:superfamily II DNA helicase RecQ
LRQHFPQVPILAVTATASDQVRQDCAQIFQLSRDYAFFRSSANRPNLIYQVRPKESPSEVIQDMVDFIREKHPRGAGIVYTYSRKDADTVADQLCEEGIVAEAYHSEYVLFRICFPLSIQSRRHVLAQPFTLFPSYW